MDKIYLYFENGFFCEANSVGVKVESLVGEVVFNTSMSGYQEIMTDPSYRGQFVLFTMPEIGNVGTNDIDVESNSIHVKGIIARNISTIGSNYRSNKSLVDYLIDNNKVAITNIDTIRLTHMLRDNGNMMMVCSHAISDKSKLKKILDNEKHIDEYNYIPEVSATKEYFHTHGIYSLIKKEYERKSNTKTIAVLDFGVKKNILNRLYSAGFNVIVYPYDTKAEFLINEYTNGSIDAVFLSNGPGNPIQLNKEVDEIKKLIEANIPIFAICLGHQLLSMAFGYDTFRLKFGHHGSNHPVKNMNTNLVEITTQNHNFGVSRDIEKIANITHINLFDNTIEGLMYKDRKIQSIQHHPEASSGPHDSSYLFKEFFNLV